MTAEDRKIMELTERLESVQAERDTLRAVTGHQARFIARVMAEAELLKSQLDYFDARKGDSEIGKNYSPLPRG